MEQMPASVKKAISRLRSEVRQLSTQKGNLTAFTGLVSGNYWTQICQKQSDDRYALDCW
jgi:hypothetical protein